MSKKYRCGISFTGKTTKPETTSAKACETLATDYEMSKAETLVEKMLVAQKDAEAVRAGKFYETLDKELEKNAAIYVKGNRVIVELIITDPVIVKGLLNEDVKRDVNQLFIQDGWDNISYEWKNDIQKVLFHLKRFTPSGHPEHSPG